MKTGFIRILWGIQEYEGRSRYYRRRTKINNDIDLVLHNKYCPAFKVYVFGKDNYSYLIDKGFDCKLIDDKPIVWDIDTQQFRHKFEAFKVASEDFDKFVFVDWDMMFVKPVPDYFWNKLALRQPFQAIMRVYHRKKAMWRKRGWRTIPCGSFVYIGNKELPLKLIDCWEKLGKPWGEEVVFAKYTEEAMGGFTGTAEDLEKYWNMFEPPFFSLQNIFSPQKMATKDLVIAHYNENAVRDLLKHALNSKKIEYDWLQKEVRTYKNTK